MKKCPFCAEEILDEAIKCKHCGEFLDASIRSNTVEKKVQWYFRTPFIIMVVCCAGPLALPLIWMRPDTTREWKIGLTLVILFISWVLYKLMMGAISNIQEYYNLIEGL